MTEKQKKLLEKFDNILEKYGEYSEKHASAQAGTVTKHELKLNSLATFDTAKKLFSKFVFSLPDDKKDQIYEEFVKIYVGIVGEENYKSNVLKGVVPERFPTPESRKYPLFYNCPDDMVKNGTVRNILDKSADFMDENTLDGILSDIDNYKSYFIHNIKVYPLRARVAELKEKNKERIADEGKRNAINAELDLIAETVITSTPRYSMNNGDGYDSIFRNSADSKLDALNEKALREEENKHLADYFEVLPSGKYGGCRSVNQKHSGDIDMINVFCDDKIKLVIPEDRKKSLLKIINYMREKKIVVDNAFAGEGQLKVYGFRRIYDAHNNLVKAIESDDLDVIKNARETYQTEVENMRGLYNMIKSELNPTTDMMIGNVISYRENWLPNEFKNDLVCNAFVNALFNLNSTLVQNGISVEEMVENPNRSFFKILEKSAATAMPNEVLKEKSNAEAIKIMAEGATTGKYTSMGIARNLEFLQALTYGTDVYEKNSLATMLVQSYGIYITAQMTMKESLTTEAYLKKNAVETISNIMLVNPEDRDFDKLSAIPSYNIAVTEKIPPFDSMEYATLHNVEAGKLIERINATVTELAAMDISQHFERTKNSTLIETVHAAQMAAYKYLMVHPAPAEDVMSKKEFDQLKKIMQSPERVFAKALGKELVAEVRKSKSPYEDIVKNGKEKLDAARTEARAAENDYATRVSELKESGSEADLNALMKGELERLDKAYTDGKLPKTYYEARRLDVANGKHENTAPFSADEYPTFNEFKEQYKGELDRKELTKDDVKMFYDRMMENVRFEENKFTLIATGNLPNPTLYEFNAIEETNIHDVKEPIEIPELAESNKGPRSPEIKETRALNREKFSEP